MSSDSSDTSHLELLGRRELRSTLLYVRASPAPVTADDAAVALGVHRSVARGRLERLLQSGLLEAGFSRRSGRSGPGAGRPAKLYSPAPEPEVLEFPPRRFPELVARLLDEVPADGREDALLRVGRDFGRKLGAGLRPGKRVEAGLEHVCATVRSLGFHAALERVDADTAVINTPTCPLRPLVAERPEAAHIDRGMWAGLVERGVHGISAESVECETHSCLDDGETCSVVIRFRR
ncbi:MAG: helix-turn-helix transcriptional regulator [Verrucomicrobiota bacterium]